jgi:hypothetical protein
MDLIQTNNNEFTVTTIVGTSQLITLSLLSNLVEDHPMNISGKFGSILFNGFREEDLNVKS